MLAWEDGQTDEAIEASKNHLINECTLHVSNYYIGGTTNEETDMDSEAEEYESDWENV